MVVQSVALVMFSLTLSGMKGERLELQQVGSDAKYVDINAGNNRKERCFVTQDNIKSIFTDTRCHGALLEELILLRFKRIVAGDEPVTRSFSLGS